MTHSRGDLSATEAFSQLLITMSDNSLGKCRGSFGMGYLNTNSSPPPRSTKLRKIVQMSLCGNSLSSHELIWHVLPQYSAMLHRPHRWKSRPVLWMVLGQKDAEQRIANFRVRMQVMASCVTLDDLPRSLFERSASLESVWASVLPPRY